MNTAVSAENLDTVCEGCLSQERPELTTEVTADVKKLYYEILNIAVENLDSVSLRLCLECKANILKYDAFKKQVIEAHQAMNEYLVRERIFLEHNINPHNYEYLLLYSSDEENEF